MSSAAAVSSRNSPASNSGKFSRLDMVRASDLPERYRTRLARLMEQFNFTGDELWMATESCQVAIGKVYVRRKPGTITRTRQDREEKCELGPCEYASRRTVQRLLRDLVEVFGVLEVVYEANRWVPYGGDTVFRHSRTYRLRPEKLQPQQTFREWRMQQKSEHTVTSIRRPAASAPTAPEPTEPPKPEHAHRSTRHITRDEKLALFNVYLALKKSGMTNESAIAEVRRQFKDRFTADEIEYAVKIVVAKEWRSNGRHQTSATEERDKRIDEALRNSLAKRIAETDETNGGELEDET